MSFLEVEQEREIVEQQLLNPISCFYNAGVLIVTTLLFGVYTRAPDCWKLPIGAEAL